MVQPHSTFYGKPISSQTPLQSPASKGCLFSIQNQKGCGYFHGSFFSRMALYFGCRSSANKSRLYKDAPKRWIHENGCIFHCDFLEVGKSKSKQEALLVLEPIEEFYQVGCWSHISPTQLKKLKERKPTGCWDGRWGVSRVATVWRQNEEEQYPHEHWCKRPWLLPLGLVTATFVAVGRDCSPNRFLVSITQLKQTANVLWMPVPRSVGEKLTKSRNSTNYILQ